MMKKCTHRFSQLLPALILLFLLVGYSNPSSAIAQNNDLSVQIDDYLQSLTEYGFSGAVLVAINDEIILAEGYGLADEANQIGITAETVFDTASLSKQFTGAAIIHLVETEQLQVDDTLVDIFENVPADKAEITIHQLLTHTSGLPEFVYDRSYQLDREDAVQRVFDANLVLEPGTRYLYSDTGYGLLAAIVEVVSGQSFQDYLEEYLFKPANMHQTGFYNDSRWDSLHVANAYLNGRDRGSVAELPGPYWDILGFGGVMTTVGDLYRWSIALQNGNVLSPESVELLFTPYVSEDNNGLSYYGYGWVVMDAPSLGTMIWHDGADLAHNAIFLNLADHDMQIIVLSNRIDETRTDEIFYGIETGFILAQSIIEDDFSVSPPFVE